MLYLAVGQKVEVGCSRLSGGLSGERTVLLRIHSSRFLSSGRRRTSQNRAVVQDGLLCDGGSVD